MKFLVLLVFTFSVSCALATSPKPSPSPSQADQLKSQIKATVKASPAAKQKVEPKKELPAKEKIASAASSVPVGASVEVMSSPTAQLDSATTVPVHAKDREVRHSTFWAGLLVLIILGALVYRKKIIAYFGKKNPPVK